MQPLAREYNVLSGVVQGLDPSLQSIVSQVVSAVTAAFTEIKGAGWSASTDTLEQIAASGGGGGLDAAGVRLAIGLATNNLDAQLGGISADTSELQANQGNWLTATGFSTPLNVTDARDAVQSDIAAIPNAVATIPVGQLTLQEALKVLKASVAGKMLVSGSAITFRNLSDTKNVISATMDGGSRTSIDLDVT